MTVADLFQLNKDYGRIEYIVGREGSGRKILDIDILEIPDGMYWVKEGDFIITMGYFFTVSDVSFENFVRMLIRNKAAGLGVKLGRFFEAIPEKALSLAQKHQFPIINYPLHMSYKSMTRPVLNYLLGEETYSGYVLKEYKKELNELVRGRYEIGAICEHLKRYINHEVFLVWENVSEFIYRTSEEGSREIRRILEGNRFHLASDRDGKIYELERKRYRIFRTGGKDQVLAFLCVMEREERPFTETDREILRETLPYIIIWLYSETRMGQYVGRSVENFFADVMDGNYQKEEEMRADARALGLAPDRLRCIAGVSVAQMSTDETDRLYRRMGLYLDSCKCSYTLYSNAGAVFTILAPAREYASPREMDWIFSDLVNDLRESFHRSDLRLCVSRLYGRLGELPQAQEEFRFLLQGELEGESSVCYYEDFMADHLLAEMQEQPAVCHVYQSVMERIERYDRENKAEMRKTLSVLTECSFNLSQAAQKLYLHRNTMYRRVEKIEAILGFDLENAKTRLLLELMMQMDRVKREDGAGGAASGKKF